MNNCTIERTNIFCKQDTNTQTRNNTTKRVLFINVGNQYTAIYYATYSSYATYDLHFPVLLFCSYSTTLIVKGALNADQLNSNLATSNLNYSRVLVISPGRGVHIISSLLYALFMKKLVKSYIRRVAAVQGCKTWKLRDEQWKNFKRTRTVVLVPEIMGDNDTGQRRLLTDAQN